MNRSMLCWGIDDVYTKLQYCQCSLQYVDAMYKYTNGASCHRKVLVHHPSRPTGGIYVMISTQSVEYRERK